MRWMSDRSHRKIRSVMIPFMLLVLLPAGPAETGGDPQALRSGVLSVIEKAEGFAYTSDAELDLAASDAAETIAGGSASWGPADDHVRSIILEALRARGVTDARVVPLAVIAPDPESLYQSLDDFLDGKGRKTLAGRTLGVGAAAGKARVVCVLAGVDRVLRLGNAPQALAKPAKVLLKGDILGKVSGLHVVVQTPDLRFLKPTVKIKGSRLTTVLPLSGPEGCYRVEVLGDLGYGPSVLNLFCTCVGKTAPGDAGLAGTGLIPEGAADKAASKNRAWALFHAVNAMRGSRGVEPLKPSPDLAGAALDHGRDMKANDFFGHTSPTRGTLEERMASAKVPFSAAAEVLTVAQEPLRAAENLAASPSHLCSMLDGAFTHMGVAVVKWSDGRIFVVIMARL
jgi:uncharacterized protein YkwD